MSQNQKTVRDLKNQVKKESGVQDHGEFCDKSDSHRIFWEKLNDIGWNMKTKEPEECNDIDATAYLTDEYYKILLEEFRSISYY